MRLLVAIFCVAIAGSACVKKTPAEPVPTIAYKDFQAWKVGNRDTAIMTISYVDSDGDLFRNSTDDGPNTVLKTFVFNVDSNKFVKDQTISYAITQPGDGFYKGKSIKGDIIIPMSQFRPNPNVKEIKFELFMVDMAENKSNTVVTPQFSLTF